ncbi:hypothetical protein FRC10_011734 [Ceratobasidium sp. 414]|nr:hypothetical protein FRC10_011734 [Ceratobasidium sp. 414]
MVFDATTSAFPRLATPDNKSTLNPSISPAPKLAAAQSLRDASNRPTKRRRTLQTDMKESLGTPTSGSSSVPPAIDFDVLDAARRRASARVMSLWESLAARYARPLDEDDEIDILTGEIYKDRGVLRAASERGWKIGIFGEAIQVEPIIGASETETETETNECDDEGEEGDAAGDAEAADEEGDAFESWSYDFQYRELPPPRPELSPQDAEDLAEFLAAERAIHEENAPKNENKQELEVDEDEVVYLGDSLHNPDGALRDDDSDDDEFSSFAVGDSTLQLAKQEESEDDDVSSILGALALGKSPQTRSSGPMHMCSVVDTRVVGSHDQNARTRAETPSTRNVRPSANPSACVRPGSEVSVEGELIIIESDSDEDVESPPKIRSTLVVAAPSGRSISSVSVSPSGTIQPNRTSFSAMVASLQASAITGGFELEIPTSSPLPSSISSPSNGLSAKVLAKPKMVVARQNNTKTPLKHTDEPQRASVVTTTELKTAPIQATGVSINSTNSKPKSRKKPLVMEVVLTSPPCTSKSVRTPTPKRESSVIDIESDSEDELAGFNAGEGSMRWEPPVKDEDDSDEDWHR